MLKPAAAIGLLILLTACSTTVQERTPLAIDRAGGVIIDRIDGAAGPDAPADAPAKLTAALRARLATSPPGATRVTLRFTIWDYRLVRGGARLVGGSLAGNNHMKVSVSLMDGAGASLGQFDVERNANPGSYGVLFDQQQHLIDAVADAIAGKLQAGGPQRSP